MSQESHQRIYLDNAATSWPKPEEVYQAVDHYQREVGAPAGRSGYSEATAVARGVQATRQQAATLLGASDASHLIFTFNGTDALNLVLHGLLRPGDHVVTTVIEHNSVLRPLSALEDAGQISVTRVGCSGAGVIDPADVEAAIRPTTRLVAVSHASNVTGAIQPIADVVRIAHAAGALVLCDAAQTVGHVHVNLRELDIDFLAVSGHKGLMGPLGTGLLAMQPQAATLLRAVRQGGTGTLSQQARQPDELPEKFESGNLNVPGILGLGAGIDFLITRGVEKIEQHGRALTQRLLDGFQAIKGLRVLGPAQASERVPLVSILLEGYDPQEVAASLDAAYRIQVRPGLHCAPLMHEALGSMKRGGSVRFSLGAFTTEAEIDATLQAVAELATAEISV